MWVDEMAPCINRPLVSLRLRPDGAEARQPQAAWLEMSDLESDKRLECLQHSGESCLFMLGSGDCFEIWTGWERGKAIIGRLKTFSRYL